MRISIFGLGYVGAVSTACLARDGHTVFGVDTDKVKVELINQGCSPIVEKDLNPMIKIGVEGSRIQATTDARHAVLHSDISFICVGTPSNGNGSLRLTFVERVSQDIGKALREKDSYHVIVARSTMLPGTVENTIKPIIEEASGKKAGEAFGLAINPEFLRESTAVYDFYNPPKTVIGELSQRDGDMVASLYKGINAPMIRTSIRTAEMVKYTDNIFHALKITFGNEIGNVCKALGIDAHEVMAIFCQDTKLNLSPYYLKPGFAFGGSCLPKDLRAMIYKARSIDVEAPVLNAIFQSNRSQLEQGLRLVMATEKKKIGVLGFAFKGGTDDLRESPIVELIEILLGKGYDLKIYDRNVSLAKLRGANKYFIENHIPHIAQLMVENLEEIISHAEVLVIGNKSDEFVNMFCKLGPDQHVVDLVRIAEAVETEAKYEGICW